MYTAPFNNTVNLGVIFYGAGAIQFAASNSTNYQKIYSPSLTFVLNPSTITATQASAAIDTKITDAYNCNPNSFTFMPSADKICYGLISGTDLTDVTLLGMTGACSDGTYPSLSLSCDVCIICPSNCTACSSTITCTTCNNGSYVSSDGSCAVCSSPCATCSNGTCTSCINGYYLSSGSCQACNSSCLTCSGSPTNCLTCSWPYYLINNTCILIPSSSSCYLRLNEICEGCGNGFYLSLTNCLPCNSSCAECSGTANYCSSCIEGYSLTPAYTCIIASTSCNLPCASCSAATPSTCTSCIDGYYLTSNGCTPCESPCLTCSGAGNSSCTSCNNTHALSGSTCEPCNDTCITCSSATDNCTTCAESYVATLSGCQQCEYPCFICFWGGSFCGQCQYSYYNYNNTCLPCAAAHCEYCFNAPSTCSSCWDQYYLSSPDCLPCASRCQSCSGASIYNCQSCVNGYYYLSDSSMCVTTCPNSYFLNGSNSSCEACDTSCAICTDQSHSNCTACIAGYYLQPAPNTTVCLPTCPPHYWQNNLTNTCDECNSACSNCTDSTNSSCTACNTGYYYHTNSCITCAGGPPSDQVGSGFDFSTCCRAYSNDSGNRCVECDAGFYLDQGSCVIACPSGTCNTFVACTSASDCTVNISQPECNGTICMACSNDADCQQWYDQTEESCNLTSGACFLNIGPVTEKIVSICSTLATSSIIAVTGAATISAFMSVGLSSQSIHNLRITRLASLLRYVNIQFPYQAEVLFESFSISQGTMQKILIASFGSQQFNQSTSDLPARFTKFDDSSLFLKNAGNPLLIFMFVALAIPINRLCLYFAIKKRNKVWTRRFLTAWKTFEWNCILGWILGSYPDLVLGVSLQMYDLPFSNPIITTLSWISFVVCTIIGPAVILFPIIGYYLMRAGKKTRAWQYHEIRRYEVLISDFKENNKETKSCQILNFLRAQAVIFPLVFWQRSPIAQISFTLIITLVINAFYLLKVGYKSRFTNFVVFMSELLFFIGIVGVFLHVVCNSGVEKSNQNLVNAFGWVIVSALVLLMLFTSIISILGVLKLAWIAVKSIRARYTASTQQKRSHVSRTGIPDVSFSSFPPPNTSLRLERGNTSGVHNPMLEESDQDLKIDKTDVSKSKAKIRGKRINLPDGLQEESAQNSNINKRIDLSTRKARIHGKNSNLPNDVLEESDQEMKTNKNSDIPTSKAKIHGKKSNLPNVKLEKSDKNLKINKIDLSKNKAKIRGKRINLPDTLQEKTVRSLKINNKYDISKHQDNDEIYKKNS